MILNLKKPLLIFTLAVTMTTYCLAKEVPCEHVAGFSPDGSALNVVLTGITHARQSIDVAAYSFTSSPIATALVDAARRGMKVRVVADEKPIIPAIPP
jgi:phosphatidylserine/phosphatidylglycerophosphate/cardiolipin synthase-like enzyme